MATPTHTRPPNTDTEQHGKLSRFDLKGTKLFQQRAVSAFPLLVRQAKAEQPISYLDLAHELGMPNPRNLNAVLGAVAYALRDLSSIWKKPIPPLNFIVVNQHTGIPGKSVAGLTPAVAAAFRKGTLAYKRRVVDTILHEVFSFGEWDKVLSHFGLQPAKIHTLPTHILPSPPDASGQGAGESEDHRRLKEFVARNPQSIGIKGFRKGSVEFTFPSADVIDILFTTDQKRVGVEVKGIRSDELDIRRGLYQCVKYRALMEACLKAEQKQMPIEVILVLGGPLPETLRAEKDTLGIDCRVRISVPPDFKC
jgi:hypothetical protein